MSDVTLERGAARTPSPIASPAELLPYALFVSVLTLVLVYFVGGEQSALAVFSGGSVHEFVHDARHLLGFPCH